MLNKSGVRIMPSILALKQEAHKLIDQLPDDASWQDLIYRLAVRADIEAGLQDSAAGRVTPVDDVLKEFGFAE
jgi:predicted transcriptional regulator